MERFRQRGPASAGWCNATTADSSNGKLQVGRPSTAFGVAVCRGLHLAQHCLGLLPRRRQCRVRNSGPSLGHFVRRARRRSLRALSALIECQARLRRISSSDRFPPPRRSMVHHGATCSRKVDTLHQVTEKVDQLFLRLGSIYHIWVHAKKRVKASTRGFPLREDLSGVIFNTIPPTASQPPHRRSQRAKVSRILLVCTLSDFANTDGAPPSTNLHDTLLGSSQPIAEIRHMRRAKDTSMLSPWFSCLQPRLGQAFLNSESRCTRFTAKSCHCVVETNGTTCVGACDSAIGARCKAEAALSCASSRALHHEGPLWTALNILETTITLSSLEAFASTDDCGSVEVLDATLVG